MSRYTRFTARELQIMRIVALDRVTNEQMSALLGLSIKTVETHRTNIVRKLRRILGYRCSTREITLFALFNGFIPVDQLRDKFYKPFEDKKYLENFSQTSRTEQQETA